MVGGKQKRAVSTSFFKKNMLLGHFAVPREDTQFYQNFRIILQSK